MEKDVKMIDVAVIEKNKFKQPDTFLYHLFSLEIYECSKRWKYTAIHVAGWIRVEDTSQIVER